ncbi:MAG: hypothetical protein WED00_13585 [Aquisalimonadaceae bacterium]
MDLVRNFDVRAVAKQLKHDTEGEYLRELLEEIDGKREQMEDLMNLTTDIDRGLKIRAMIDGLDSVSAMVRSLWAHTHGRLPEGV